MKTNFTQPLKALFALLLLACVFGQPLYAAAPLTATVTVTNASCFGSYDGSIFVHASGGTAPYLYSFYQQGSSGTPFTSSDSLTYIPAGNYVINVTDAAGNSTLASITITNPTPVLITDSVVNTTGGNNNGAMYANATGGTPPYSYLWSTGDTTPAVTGLAKGTNYSLQVNDSKGCNNSINSIIVDTGSNILRGYVNYIHPNGCYPSQQLDFSFQVQGGTLPYLYSIDNEPFRGGFTTGTNFYNVTGNIHRIRVQDARNVIFAQVDTFHQIANTPLVLQGSITESANAQSSGSVVLTATGGIPPYTYCCQTTNLTPGNYGFRVTDANGCQAYTTAVIIDSTQIVPFAVFDSLVSYACTNVNNYNYGAIYLQISGGRIQFYYSIDNDNFYAGMNYVHDKFIANISLDAGNHVIHVLSADTAFDLHVSVPADNLDGFIHAVNATGALSDGIAYAVVTSGAAPYTYSWNLGNTTDTVTGIAAVNTLSVTVQDKQGCSFTANGLIDSGALTGYISIYQPTACGTASLYLYFSGGKQPYRDYAGNNLTSGQLYNYLQPGVHYFPVIDGNNDTLLLTAVINPAPAPLTLTYTSTPASQYLNNGKVILTPAGGTPPYHIFFNNNRVYSDTITTLGPGPYYSAYVADSNNCAVYLYNIQVNDSTGDPFTGTTNFTPNTPCDTTNGSISVSVSGGTTPYVFTLGDRVDNSFNGYVSYDGYPAGVYNITATDAMGQVYNAHVTVYSVPAEPAIQVSATITNTTGGLNNGAAVLHIAGGTPPYTYNWSPYASGANVTGLEATNYNVNIYDALGCQANLSFAVDTGNSALKVITQVNNALCDGGGSINITVTGGTAPYYNAIDTGAYTAGANGFSNLFAGVYAVHVKDAAGTIITVYDTLTAQPGHLNITATVLNATAPNAANGAITLQVGGYSGYYTVQWQDYSTQLKDSFLFPGTYYASVTDSFGCTYNLSYDVGVGQQQAFGATLSTTNVACYGVNTGSIVVYAHSPYQPINYEIDNTGFTPYGQFFNLTAGIYHITLTDGSGATLHLVDTVTQPASPLNFSTIQTNNNTNQQNGGIALNITGGIAPYTTLWSDVINPTNSQSGLTGGYYLATITDSAGCAITASFNVDSSVLARISAAGNLHCNGDSTGTISIAASGSSTPYQYRLNNGSYQANSAFTNLGAGSYTVTVRSATNDTFVVHEVLSQPTAIVVNGTVTNTSSGQSNGAINVTVSGGAAPYNYNWGAGVTTANRIGLSAGTYTLTVTDSSGCSATQTYSIVGVGINTVLANAGIQLYPNPSAGAVTLSMQNATGVVNVNVYNTIGQLVITKNIDANGSLETPLQMQSLPDGIYEVKITNNNVTSVARVVIAK